MDQGLPSQVVSRKFYRRILPGLRRLKHLRSILIRNIRNESVEKGCQLYFTIHCHLQNSKDSNDKETEILAYTSETVVDTVNPEWNEFGNPVDITKEAINEKEFILRVWNKEKDQDRIIIEVNLSVQDVDYIAPLEGIDISKFNMESLSSAESSFINKNMSIGAIEQIFNALPFNAVILQMTDGYFAPHAVTELLQKKGVLEPVYAPVIDSLPPGLHSCDFHFTLTSLQQLYLQQSHTQQNDDRMMLMKSMVEESMKEPMAANNENVESKCLINDIKALKEEQILLESHLTEETSVIAEMKEKLVTSHQNLQKHYESISTYEKDMSAEEQAVTALKKEDQLVQESLHARRTRLLAFLSFLYPISVNRSNEYMIRGIVLPEQVLRTTGALHDSKWNEVNAALGFLSHMVLLLSKYFNMPLLYCIDYKASFSSIYNPQQEPPVHHPLFLGAVNMKDANIRSGIAFLRGNVQNILSVEGLELEIVQKVSCYFECLFISFLMSEEQGEERFDKTVTLEMIREKVQQFATERDWDQFHQPRNLLLAMMGEVGEVCEILQWKGEVKPGVPELSEEEKVHLGEELSDVLIYLIRLSDRCGIDLPKAALRKLELNAKKYPADKVRGSSKKYNEY